MPSDDYDETIDTLRIRTALIDPTGTTYTALEDAGGGGGADVSVSDDGSLVLSSPTDIDFGDFLDVVADDDQTVTVHARNTDTNTHITVENVDGTAFVKNIARLHAGANLVFRDDGDQTVTLDAEVHPTHVKSGAVDMDTESVWVTTGVTSQAANVTIPFTVTGDAEVEEHRYWDAAAGELKVKFAVANTGANYDGTVTVNYDVLTWTTPDTTVDTTTTTGLVDVFSTDFEDGTFNDLYTSIYGGSGPGTSNVNISTAHAHEGTNSLHVRVNQGEHYGWDSTYDPRTAGHPTNPKTLYQSVWVYFASPFVLHENPSTDSKFIRLINYYNRDDSFSGGCDGTNGWSSSIVYLSDGNQNIDLDVYQYHMDQPGSYGEHLGNSVRFGGTGQTVARDEWHHFYHKIKLNTVSDGVALNNGHLKAWVNGDPIVDREDMRYTLFPENGVQMQAQVYHGGSEVAPGDQDFYFDTWQLGTEDFIGLDS